MAEATRPPDVRDAAEKAERVATAKPAVAVAEGAVASPPRSAFSGIGVFTAWEPTAANGLKCDWIAVQLDEESGANLDTVKALKGTHVVHGWEARPSEAGVWLANEWGCAGYIGQAETQEQIDACLALDTSKFEHTALVGNPSAWTRDAFNRAALQGWELLLEWYWNAQPSYKAPNASFYPHFTSVVFGSYNAAKERLGKELSEATRGEIAAEEAKGPFYVPLSAYRAVWQGNYAVYLGETLSPDSPDDRSLLGAV